MPKIIGEPPPEMDMEKISAIIQKLNTDIHKTLIGLNMSEAGTVIVSVYTEMIHRACLMVEKERRQEIFQNLRDTTACGFDAVAEQLKNSKNRLDS